MTDETTTQDNEINETKPAEAAPQAEAAAEEAPFAKLEAELEKLKSEVLYAQAETQNVRRRLEKEKADAQAYAATAFARDILSVADNLTRALAAIPEALREDEKMKPLVTGLEMTGKELENVFQRHGISKIEALGGKLDPNRHQAMLEVESEAEPGTIVQELQAGYLIKDRLLRPALVSVAKAG
ncbi:nucleotide exchange factor GrpE [Flavisphingomonas formosensis]|uniref:nucleotide exchange factor GrpE n=1 Tax=Flavisphingomonas formosensis TaxID=861534 RepID=UPI0012F9A1E7|nr:nucleotide exchange factor GrpE [Sphingomonas formosensis]